MGVLVCCTLALFEGMKAATLLPTVHICSQAPASWDVSQRKEIASKDLKRGLEGLATSLFGNVEMRWVDAYFPFTTPSAELEILFRVSYTYLPTGYRGTPQGRMGKIFAT